MNENPGPIGTVMKWKKFVITIGTASDDLQAQIDNLQAQLDKLREDFDIHSHPYLTGKSIGHNKVEASTGLPWLSDDDATMSTPALDVCSKKNGKSKCRKGK